MKLLLIEDSQRLRSATAKALRKLGHVVDEAGTLADGVLHLRTGDYDAVALDRMLPDGEGLEALAQWRKSGERTPVVVLTALGAVHERVRGLGMGADDYLPKPFSFDELAARLEAVARRGSGDSATSRATFGPLAVDLGARHCALRGEMLPLGAREWALLELLARRPGHIYSRAQIEAQIYSDEDSPLSNAVDAVVYKLRRKLGDAEGTFIQTHRGLGYALQWKPNT